jgi:hypothetical protein
MGWRDMPSRTCTLCKVAKPLSEYHKKAAYHDGLDPWCKACKHEKDTVRYWSDPSRYKRKSAAYHKAHPDKARKWKLESAERHRDEDRQKRRAEIQDLSDHYVRQLFCENNVLTFSDIPQCLVEARRELIKLKRAIHEKL